MNKIFKDRLSYLFSGIDFPTDAFCVDTLFNGRPIVVYGAGEAFHYFKEVVIRQYTATDLVQYREAAFAK